MNSLVENRIPTTVFMDRMRTFYTYVWHREDGTPYYVGKGVGDRAFTNENHVCNRPDDVSRIAITNYNTESEALAAEKVLIAKFGRKDLGTGTLENRSNGGGGRSSGGRTDLTGQRFGLLSVMQRGEPTGSRATWLCHCLCGTERTFREDHLLAGRSKSCGCATARFKKAKMEKLFSLVNRRFGKLLVVWRAGSERVGESSHSTWACKCDCGKVIEARGGSLTSGKITHCGCMTVLKLEAHA